MQGIMERILARRGSDITFEQMSPRDYEQFKVDGLNNTPGNRNEEDGYDCGVCKNKGYIVKLAERGDGTFTQAIVDCKCAEVRRSIMRMKRSGLKDIIRDYTFDKFKDTEPWQKTLKEAAMEYAKTPDGWFFLGGQSGCGKSHLCTAICREFLLAGRSVQYMLWRDDITRIKAAVTDSEEYRGLVDKFKTVDILYIDDLFKTGKAPDGSSLKITGADINVAFEIINYRYNNPALVTIISSELSEDDLLDIDEAIGGRIYERAKAFSIAKDRQKNYRIRKSVTL